jgi:hypothetical protein
LKGFQKDLKISTSRKEKFGKTFETVGGFCFVVFVTDLNRPNAGKDYDDIKFLFPFTFAFLYIKNLERTWKYDG